MKSFCKCISSLNSMKISTPAISLRVNARLYTILFYLLHFFFELINNKILHAYLGIASNIILIVIYVIGDH